MGGMGRMGAVEPVERTGGRGPTQARRPPREEAEMQDKSHQSQPPPATEPVEPRGARLRRHGHRTPLRLGLHPHDGPRAVIALAVANTRQVKLSWVVGTSHASLVWVIRHHSRLAARDRHEHRLPSADATPGLHRAPVVMPTATR
jgi:hypothetical protein